METANQISLYERLGRAKGISLIVDDVVEAHMNNELIKNRFTPYRDKPEQLAMIKKHTCDFFGAGSGGPEQYSGRDMQAAHQGMNITEAEYNAAVDDILLVLNKHQIDEQTQKEVREITDSLKPSIIKQ